MARRPFKSLDFALKPCVVPLTPHQPQQQQPPAAVFAVKKFSKHPSTPLLSQSSKKSLPEIPEHQPATVQVFSSKPTITIFSEDGGEPPLHTVATNPSPRHSPAKQPKPNLSQKIEGRKVDEFTGVLQLNIGSQLCKACVAHPAASRFTGGGGGASRNQGHVPSLSTFSNLQPPSCKGDYLRFTPVDERHIAITHKSSKPIENQYSSARSPCSSNLLVAPSTTRSRPSTARAKKKQTLTSADRIRRQKREDIKQKRDKAQRKTLDLR